MARFINQSPNDLRFEIDGKWHEVPVGGEWEIADRIAYCVRDRGLPLTPAPPQAPEAPAPVVVAVPADAPKPAPAQSRRSNSSK